MNSLTPKKPAKDERELLVLLRLVDLFLKTGKPIASSSLREYGLHEFSPATIRNYFAKLEQNGYLKQPHASGGRIPTQSAYRLYAKTELLNSSSLPEELRTALEQKLSAPTRNIAQYLQGAAAYLSELTSCAIFLSTPRFDQDFVLTLRLFPIDHERCLGVILTDFGLVHTELLPTPGKIDAAKQERLEAYFSSRIQNKQAARLEEEEEKLAQSLYNELMLRHIVHHTNFYRDDLCKTGFAKLLDYYEYKEEPSLLGSALSLFESPQKLSSLLQAGIDKKGAAIFVGEELSAFSDGSADSTVITLPYRINQSIVGGIGLLGPMRIPYRTLLPLLTLASELISETLTASVYKFKISYRMPRGDFSPISGQRESLSLENQSRMESIDG